MLNISVSPDTVHDPVGHVPSLLGGGLMVIVYPVISDPPLSDGAVHSMVALLYVEDSCIQITELGGLESSNKKLCLC